MDADGLKNVEEVFHLAMDLKPSERQSFLDKICGGDETLRQEVESLLAVKKSSNDLLNNPPEYLAAEMFQETEKRANLSGTEISHYKIIELLGTGGMGEVYLAKDKKLQRNIALKLLPFQFSTDVERKRRFEKEALAVSALNHPNIITIYEVEDTPEYNFIATEFVDGQTLGALIAAKGMSLQDVVKIAIQITSALESAHSVGIIHRDIKPANIMIRKDGIVKVLDFGLAKLTALNSGDPFTWEPAVPSRVMGTIDYMSPEQAKRTDLNHQSDIFSFGIVLYEMLTGELPFQGESSLDMIQSILKSEAKPIDDDRIPKELGIIVEKCLKKDRSERYQGFDAILTELQGVSQKHGYNLGPLQRETHEIKDVNTQSIRGLTASGNSQTGEFANPRKSWVRKNIAGIGLFGLILFSIFSFLGFRYFGSSQQLRSIAVMPFVNESGNADVDYLADGMTESLIQRLSNISSLTIKARSTVFTYKGKAASALQIGKELNVDAVLMGHLVQRGDDLKLNLELVETATQNILWSEIYERKINDLIGLQSEIARDLSERMVFKLTRNEQFQIAKTYTTNSEAHQLYLKGRFHWNKRSVKNFQKAIEYFDLAITKDPSYALAYSGLADTYALIPLYGGFRPKEYFPKAKDSALKAIEIDENLAEAHASLGYIINTYDFDWVGAESEFRKAISLNPNYPTAHQWYAEHLAFKGKHVESLVEISKALELDPFSLVINRMKGNVLGFSGRSDEAIDQLLKTIELYPESSIVRFNLGDAFAAKGKQSEAIFQYLKAFELDGRSPEEVKRYDIAYKMRGWSGFWYEYLDVLLEQRKTSLAEDENAYIDNEAIAFAYAAAKNKEKAIEFLEKAYEERDPSLVTIKMSSVYDFLNEDQRYISLIKKIGLPE